MIRAYWCRSHVASHLLSRIARRIQADWVAKYGHSLYCLETFVDASRYRGVCYRAANWQLVGHSTGRSRNVTQGTRSANDRRANERLWTVIGTCELQGRSAFAFILQAVQAYFRDEPAPSLLPQPP